MRKTAMKNEVSKFLFQSKVYRKSKFIVVFIILLIVCDYLGLLLYLFEIPYEKFSYPLDVPVQEILTAIKTGNIKLPYEPVNKYNYFFLIKNEGKCLKYDDKKLEKALILYIVKSAVNHQSRRNVIRQTWGLEKRFSDVIIRRIFILGLPEDTDLQKEIDSESEKYKDLVQANFNDVYYNNTIKTIMSFKWVVRYCSKAQFIIFCDDDMYISTKNMLKFVRNPFNDKVGFKNNIEDTVSRTFIPISKNIGVNNSKFQFQTKKITYDPIFGASNRKLFAGYVFFSSPMRQKFSKWYVSLSDYPFSKYPPYVTAGAYVLSYPALEDMYYTSLFTQHFKFDDVYLGIVGKKCGISPLHNKNFFFWKKSYNKMSYTHVIASHGYSDPKELELIWEEQRSLGHA